MVIFSLLCMRVARVELAIPAMSTQGLIAISGPFLMPLAKSAGALAQYLPNGVIEIASLVESRIVAGIINRHGMNMGLVAWRLRLADPDQMRSRKLRVDRSPARPGRDRPPCSLEPQL